MKLFLEGGMRLSARASTSLFAGVLCLAMLVPSSKASDLSIAGKITLNQALQLALEKNFSVRASKFDLEIAKADVKAAKGTYDPSFELSYESGHRDEQPSALSTQSNPFFAKDEDAEIGITGNLPWGGNYDLGLDADNNRFSFTNPSLGDDIETFAGITITQPLLRDFLNGSERTDLRSAKNLSVQAEQEFREAIMDIVAEVTSAFNAVDLAQQNLAIAVRSQENAFQLLEDNRKRVENKMMAPLDVVQAESENAIREGGVLLARQNLREASNELLILLSDEVGGRMGILGVSPSGESLPPPEMDMERDLAYAFEHLPSYSIAQLEVDLMSIELAEARNERLPQLDLVASYGLSGRSSTLDDSFDDLRSNKNQSYSLGFEFSVPFANREARANVLSAKLGKRREELDLQEVEQRIMLDLDNAANRVRMRWKRLETVRAASVFAKQALEAEQKKMAVGRSTTFVVLRLQQDLVSAEQLEARAVNQYENALNQYRLAKGSILEDNNIFIDQSGQSSMR